MPFLDKNSLESLKNYKYVSCGYSWLDNKMNPFWEWFVKQMPMWLAPNLMTVLGGFFVFLLQFILTFYNLSMTQTVPRWIFFALAIAVFVYQTLDATDGKQARRTKSSSPLGQLVDHGCDSFMASFIAIQMLEMAIIHPYTVIWDMMIIWVIFIYSFKMNKSLTFSAHWNEKITKVLIHQIGNFGVTEMEFIVIFIYLITSIFGQTFWSDILLKDLCPFIQIPELIGNLQFKAIFHIILVYILSFVPFIVLLINGFRKTKNVKSAALCWVPIIYLYIIGLLLFHLTELREICALALLYISIVYSTLTCKFIVTSLAEVSPIQQPSNYFLQMEFPLFHIELFFTTIVYLILYFSGNLLTGQQKEIFFVIAFCGMCFICWWQMKTIVNEICSYLGIECFRIKPLDRESKSTQ